VTDSRPLPVLEFVPAKVRGVVFDLDGTLVDSYAAIAASVNVARERFNEPSLSLEQVRRTVGHGLEQLMIDVLGAARAKEGVGLFREHYEKICLELTTVLPGVAEGLDRLSRDGFAIAVASNKPVQFSLPILDRLGLSPSIDVVHGPDTVGSTKPEPTMIRACLRGLGLPKSAAIYVGDMLLDVESAARAELPAVLVATGSSPADELRRHCDFVYAGISELVELLHASRAESPPNIT